MADKPRLTEYELEEVPGDINTSITITKNQDLKVYVEFSGTKTIDDLAPKTISFFADIIVKKLKENGSIY